MNKSFNLSSNIHSSNSTRSTLFGKTHVKNYVNYTETINTELRHTDSDFRRRSLPQLSFETPKFHKYDFNTELNKDTSIKNVKKLKIVQWLQNFIVAWYFKILGFLKLRILRSNCKPSFLYQYKRESRWKRLWHFVNVLLSLRFLSRRLLNVRRRIQEKRYKILWIVILLLLFLICYWYLPYILSLFSMIIMTDSIKVVSPNIQTAAYENKDNIKVSLANDNPYLIIKRLNTRIENMEKSNTYQTNKIQDLKNILEKSKINCSNEINTVKLELITLREIIKKVNIQAQVEGIVAEYFGTNISKKDVSDIIEKLKLSTNKEVVFTRNSSNEEIKDQIREVVNEILKIYDADKTGRVDYALETAGGKIISTHCTQTYIKPKVVKFLGFPLYYEAYHNPQTVIQRNPMQPGVCWAFQNFPGYILIKLRNFIYVTGFTIEHPATSILPNGEMKSALCKFNVWGLIDENDSQPVIFGDYEFVNSGNSLQYFPIQNMLITVPYKYVELRIHSNHGNLDYTCLYRFRVHGKSTSNSD